MDLMQEMAATLVLATVQHLRLAQWCIPLVILNDEIGEALALYQNLTHIALRVRVQ